MEFCDLRTEFAVRVRGTALECGNRSDVLATSARDYLQLMCASQENGGWIARNFDSSQEKTVTTTNLACDRDIAVNKFSSLRSWEMNS